MSTGRAILQTAENKDGYRAACSASAPNAAARRGDQYVPYFLPAVDATRLRAEIFKIDLLNDADIVILHSSADNGYPHTRPKAVVCLPDTAVVGVADETLRNTLRHEAMHIHQRRFPALWKTKITNDGWTPVENTNIPRRFREQLRINPDTSYDPFWAWESYHVPMPIFKNADSLTLADVRIEWLDLRTGALFHEPPPSFTRKYGSPSQPEHPYEIYAVKYADEGISSNAGVYAKLIDLN